MSSKKIDVRKLLIRIVIIFVILIVVYIAYSVIYRTSSVKDIFDEVEKTQVSLSEYIVYGTHLNIKGKLEIDNSDIKKVSLCLKTINEKNDKEIDLSFENTQNGISFYTSNLINEGINLEELSINTYYMFVKVDYQNNSNKIYSIKNDTNYKKTQKENIEYYTITKNSKNSKVDIKFEDYTSDGKKLEYMYIGVNHTHLPANVYDVVIDPGHGGGDVGAEYRNYREADLALKYAQDVKKELEKLGLKVRITRDGTEGEEYNVKTVYDKNGRVNIVGDTKAKYVFSIHLNSIEQVNSQSGVEIYAPTRMNLKFAKSFADNIVKYANTKYSGLEVDYKVDKGVYVRTFKEEQIADSAKTAKQKGYEPYEIKEYTPYLYMLRETGGIATGAYIDGRNKEMRKELIL